MKKLQIIISFFSITFLINCSESTTQPGSNTFSLGDTLSIHYKEMLMNNENNIRISFENLISDSRCPIDLRCYWEGDAEIELKFRKDSNTELFTLHTAGVYFNSDTLLMGSYIKLIDVLPYPHSEIQYEPEDYIIKVIIQ